jgi:hypothetical protein
MSDPYEGVTMPNPERDRLFRSVFRPSSLEDVAEAISAASEKFHDIYVERRVCASSGSRPAAAGVLSRTQDTLGPQRCAATTVHTSPGPP